MDLVAYSFAASTAALQVSGRRAGCWMHGVVCCCPVRPTPKGGSDWTDLRDLDLDLDLSWTTGHPHPVGITAVGPRVCSVTGAGCQCF